MGREITKLNKSGLGEGRVRVILYTNKPERERESSLDTAREIIV